MRKTFSRIVWRLFPVFERFGIHVLPVNYYSPIPDTQELRNNRYLFDVPHPMYGVEMPKREQLEFVEKIVTPFEQEYRRNVGAYADPTGSFAPFNALVLYAIIRHFRPARMVEVGAGASTGISAAAFLANIREGIPGRFITIDPCPSGQLRKGCGGLDLIEERVQAVDRRLFLDLQENDILFIDSTHTVKIFGDVNYLYLMILPQLKPGVIIHIHDIFFPFDYPPHHFLNQGFKQIWQEQYLLHAFLMFNREFEVLLSTSYMHCTQRDMLTALFAGYQVDRWPSSFWMRRKKA